MTHSPPLLHVSDKVGIIPPASKITSDKILNAKKLLESWGLEVVLSSNHNSSYFDFAGPDPERLKALQAFLDDREIRAVFCARGGYGTSRIIDKLNLAQFSKFPKWVIGFSDITILLNRLFLNHFSSIHGPMPMNFFEDHARESLKLLKQILFEGNYPEIEFNTLSFNRPGHAEGPVVGGNLTILIHCIGTATQLDTNGKILFMEDVDEKLYKIDRMILHLKRAGMFKNLKGLIIGHFTRINDQGKPEYSLTDIILEHTEEYGFPICFGAPIGHIMPNYPVIIGQPIILDVKLQSASFCLK